MNTGNEKLTLGIELINDVSWMGGTLYLRNLAICLSRLPVSERPNIRLLGAPEVVSGFLDQWGSLPGFEASSGRGWWRRALWRTGRKAPDNAGIDIIYPGFGAQIPGAATVHWVPDFQHRYLPELFSEDEIIARDRAIAGIAVHPGIVVLSSEAAAEDFQHFYPERQVTPRVWHFFSVVDTCTPPTLEIKGKYRLPDKYLYLPNQFWTHKNHITVLKALAQLRRQQGLIIPLVCTGAQSDRRNLDHFSGLMQFIRDNNLSDQVHMLGLIERDDQISVLRFSSAVVQPSLFEGWSTVVEDVRAVGRPIFLSDIPVHREQLPHHCWYFRPESDNDLAALLLNQWEKLPYGPDLDAEETARKEVEERILESGRTFLDILIAARDIHRSVGGEILNQRSIE